MVFKEAYRSGQRKRELEITARGYDAFRGLGCCSFSIADDIARMTTEVRETAQQKAGEIKTPKNLLDSIGFNFGYALGPHIIITNICTSDGPVNPSTGKALYQR